MANLTRMQRDAYGRSVSEDIGVREVSVTAKEGGRAERDLDLVMRLHAIGKSAVEVCDLLDIAEEDVMEV